MSVNNDESKMIGNSTIQLEEKDSLINDSKEIEMEEQISDP